MLLVLEKNNTNTISVGFFKIPPPIKIDPSQDGGVGVRYFLDLHPQGLLILSSSPPLSLLSFPPLSLLLDLVPPPPPKKKTLS